MQLLSENRPGFLCGTIVLFFCTVTAYCTAQTAADFDSLAKAAAAARDADQSQVAIRDYQQALQLRPRWVEGWGYLGTLQYENNLYPQAIRSFQSLLKINPDSSLAWNLLGLSEFETGDYANSLAHLERAQQLGPVDDPDITRVSAYHLGVLLNQAGHFDRAFSTLIAIFGQNHVPAQVQTVLGLALLHVPLFPTEVDPSKDALVQAAGAIAAQLPSLQPEKRSVTAPAVDNDAATAIAALGALVQQYPDVPYLHYAYGLQLASDGHLKRALDQQQLELALSSQSAVPQIEISKLELQLHQPAPALRAAQHAVALAPKSQVAHQTLAAAFHAAGNLQKSKEQLAIAKSLSPEKSVREMRIVRQYAAADVSPTTQTPTNNGSPDSNETSGITQKAAALEKAGDTDAAIQLYRQELQTYPEWSAGRWSLDMLYYSTENYAQAIPALKSWVEQNPNDGTAWAVLGLCEFATKDYSNALIHLQRGQQLGLRGDQQAVQLAVYHLAILLNQKSQFDQAKDLLAPVVGPGALLQPIQIALGMAMLHVSSLPDQVPASKIALLQSAGEIVIRIQNSKYDTAFQEFQVLLKQYPDQPYLHYAYGIELAALSRYDEAIAEMHRVIQLMPASELPYNWLALIALRQHQPQQAVSPALRAVALAPDSAQAHYMLGRAYLETGQLQQALPELETAGKEMPASPEVHFTLAQAYAKAKQPEKAQQERERFAQLRAIADTQHNENASKPTPRQ